MVQRLLLSSRELSLTDGLQWWALSLESIPIVIFGVETSHRVRLTVLHGSYCQFLSLCGTHVTESLVFGGVG